MPVGERMTTAQAERLVGLQVGLALPQGQYKTGHLVSVLKNPQAVLHDPATGQISYVSIVDVVGWVAPDPPAAPAPAPSSPLAASPAPPAAPAEQPAPEPSPDPEGAAVPDA